MAHAEETQQVNNEDTEWGRAIEYSPDEAASCLDQRSELNGEPDEHMEVAIVGGGLVGLAIAIGLRQRGIESIRVYFSWLVDRSLR